MMISGLISFFFGSVLFGQQMAEARFHRERRRQYLQNNLITSDGEFLISLWAGHRYTVWRHLTRTGHAHILGSGLYFIEAVELVNRLSAEKRQRRNLDSQLDLKMEMSLWESTKGRKDGSRL